MSRGWRGVLLSFALGLGGAALAGPDVSILALFKDKALVRVDGARRVLSVGQTSPEGVKLIAADSEGATLEIDGRRKRYALGDHIGSHYAAPSSREVRLWPDDQGMYLANGSINGQPVEFLVDTGASQVALNAAQARRLGIDFRFDGQRGAVETASGVARAYRVRLDRVKIGDIQLRNVEAVVLDGSRPRHALLGMSFLRRLELKREAGALVLRQKWP
jgi:aspartyl protease family protein